MTGSRGRAATIDLRIDGFSDGELYDQGRPQYPAEAITYFVEALGLTPGTRVMDLGAGTGKLTRAMLDYGLDITAVEPSHSMRARLSASLPDVTALDGIAEDIPLPDDTVDVVLVAQAFHWFDAPRALQEIARVLRRGGRLGLIWNERDESEPWVYDLSVAMRWHDCQPYAVGMDFRPVITADGLFERPLRREFHFTEAVDHVRLRKRVLSTSYITAMTDRERSRLMQPVEALIATLPEEIDVPYRTELYTCWLSAGRRTRPRHR